VESSRRSTSKERQIEVIGDKIRRFAEPGRSGGEPHSALLRAVRLTERVFPPSFREIHAKKDGLAKGRLEVPREKEKLLRYERRSGVAGHRPEGGTGGGLSAGQNPRRLSPPSSRGTRKVREAKRSWSRRTPLVDSIAKI